MECDWAMNQNPDQANAAAKLRNVDCFDHAHLVAQEVKKGPFVVFCPCLLWFGISFALCIVHANSLLGSSLLV